MSNDDWVDWDAMDGDGAEVEEATAGLGWASTKEFTNTEPAPVRFTKKVGPGRYLMFESTPEEMEAMKGGTRGGMGTTTTTTTRPYNAAAEFDWGGLFAGLGQGIGSAAEGISEAMARQTAAEAAAGASRDEASSMQTLLATILGSQQQQTGQQAAPPGVSGTTLLVGGAVVLGVVGIIAWAATRKGPSHAG